MKSENEITAIRTSEVEAIKHHIYEVRGLRVEYRVAAKLGDVLTPSVYTTDAGIVVALSLGTSVSAIMEFCR